MGAAVSTAADIASAAAAAIPTSATRRRASLQLLTLPGRRGGVKEGIFLVPSRVAKWEFTLFRLKCTQPFFDIFLVIMVN